ncbi:MAG: HNH endonuclease [Anaeroplasmataceae bacterium]|nr:HNH endonuclease [Anaeroplasmataceae bacterium]
MSKYTTIEIWNEVYGNKEDVYDYAGRLMKKSACGNPDSKYHPTLDHIRPISKGGKDIKGNLKICHTLTNEEKDDDFPHWTANGKKFKAKKKDGESGSYIVVPN